MRRRRGWHELTLCFALIGSISFFISPGRFGRNGEDESHNTSIEFEATPWKEADQLFHSDPRWLGGDAAYSVDLGRGRVLWLFGDSFVARKASDSRKTSRMVRNSAAIQTDYNPACATIKFHWGVKRGQPADFAAPEGRVWLWPMHGIRLGDRLLLFYARVAPDHKRDSLGFKSAGWTAFLIDNPDQEPSAWTLRKLHVPDGNGKVIMGTSAMPIADFVYVFGESEPEHDVYLARWPVTAVAKGNLSSPEWWCGSEGWQANISARRPVMRDVSSEFSIQRDPRGNGFLEVNSQGFGATDIVMRRAGSLEGPWSSPQRIYRPPESDGPEPFVYAGKSHPELTGADVIITYAANGNDQTLATDMSIYFPRFVRVDFRPH